MSTWRFLFGRFTRQLWARSALYSLIALVTALAAALVGRHVDFGDVTWLGANSVGDLLKIMAASMLSVATFSLSSMVSAYASASSSTTPRASALLIEDSSSHAALSTFIGAFMFSIVGLIALSTGLYGTSGRVVMFVVTVVMIVFVVVRLLSWIDVLSRLGRVGQTIDKVEAATQTAFSVYAKRPHLGGVAPVSIPGAAIAIHTRKVGYVQHLDVGRLQRLAEEHALKVHVLATVGLFVHRATVLMRVEGSVNEEVSVGLASAFRVGDSRTFDADPRFGLVVLAEIAMRALSPAVNDPGTARDVLGTMLRLLTRWQGQTSEVVATEYPAVHVPALHYMSLLDEILPSIARDGAGLLEIGVSIQEVCQALAALDDPQLTEAARMQAENAKDRADGALTHPRDRERLTAAAAWNAAPFVPVERDPAATQLVLRSEVASTV